MQPLTRLYRAGEGFDISAEGLAALQESELFTRLCVFYALYPPHSCMSNNSRAALHHLVMTRRPDLALEIGTYRAGTTEVLARAMWEAGCGHLDTIDPYGAERCPPIIAAMPPEIRERISFRPVTSAIHFDQAMSRGVRYDFVLVDGNHEYEFARFDLECAARVLRPGGLIVMDNIDQIGPRIATKAFLADNPDWRDVAKVVGQIDPNDVLAAPPPSIPHTKFYLIEAPPHYMVGEVPRSFGQADSDSADVDGIELTLAKPACGIVQAQVFSRTFGMTLPEELDVRQRFALETTTPGVVRLPLDRPLRSAVVGDEFARRIEIVLAFSGQLALAAPPKSYVSA